MEVNEFAKFVIDNMGRATAGNALNIVNKLDNPEYYKFSDFAVELQKYIAAILADGSYNKDKCYEMLVLLDKTIQKYNSPIKYNKTFIINDFILELWRIIHGHKDFEDSNSSK